MDQLQEGSVVSCDIRKIHPYSAYDMVDFEEAIFTGGYFYARYKVRIKEIWQSLSIIEQLINKTPKGEYKVKTKAVIKLPKGSFI